MRGQRRQGLLIKCAVVAYSDSQMVLTLTPLGVTEGSPWRQPWGWESLIIRSPGGATGFACGKMGQTALPPHPGLPIWMQTYPTAYAVGYLLPPLRG